MPRKAPNGLQRGQNGQERPKRTPPKGTEENNVKWHLTALGHISVFFPCSPFNPMDGCGIATEHASTQDWKGRRSSRQAFVRPP